MNKYALRLLVALLTFSLGTAAINLFAWDKINTLTPSGVTHSSEKGSPYSLLEGRTIRLKPFDATFEIPKSWLVSESVPEPAKNLYLSAEDLNELSRHDGSDAEDAQVINSALPFENCAAHVGDKGWGDHLWNDLQGRVYVVDLTPGEIAASIEGRGLSRGLRVFEDALSSSENYGMWRKQTLNITDAPTHFILMKNLDFYDRQFGNKTVVFVSYTPEDSMKLSTEF